MADIANAQIERIYFQQIKSNNVTTHLIGFEIIMEGIIQGTAIQNAFAMTIRKHQNLQYRFFVDDTGLNKNMCDVSQSLLQIIDCSEEKLATLRTRILHDAPLGINPEKGTNIIGRLYKLSNTEHIFSVTASHLVADAQSMEILLKNFLAELQTQCLDDNQSEESLISLPPSLLNGQQSYEITKTLNVPNIKNLKALCHHENVSLFSLLMAGLTTVPWLKTDTIGVLFSNRTQENQNEVGCFVQAVPVYLYEGRSILEMAKGVKHQVAQIHASLKTKEPLPAPPRFNVMFSMVKNPETALHGPDGVSFEYLRRLHAKPECPLHIYAYQYKEKLEIVFNYDPDHWDHNVLEKNLNQYVDNLIRLSDQKNWQSEPCNNVGSWIPEVLFDHVGVAVWEMDIGLMRLQPDCNIGLVKKRVKDKSMDVELASFDTGIKSQIELVAPLSQKAPCVCFLERFGEGPYHCCWQTTSLETLLEVLNQKTINYTIIERYGQSALFPETPILFLLVQGVGLVEFIQKEQLSDHLSEPLVLEIISNDLDNASKFFHMLGCKPDHPAKATWLDSDGGIFIQVQAKEGAKESFVHRISSRHLDQKEITTNALQSLSGTWHQRVCI